MKPEELAVTARVEETNPTDRVRGTVVNVDPSGLFVVHFDNGDYVAYMEDQAEGFEAIPHKPIPESAKVLIREIHRQHGRTPPEDVIGTRRIPGARTENGDKSIKPTLTRQGDPPSIEA